MFKQNRDQARQFFLQVWHKHQTALPLEPLEAVVRDVILAHPEYQPQLQVANLTKEYLPEVGQTNPFLHLGLHIALHEQLSIDRPTGIRALYQLLASKYADLHHLEHRMIDCLADTLWKSQRDGTLPDDQAYLACLRRLL